MTMVRDSYYMIVQGCTLMGTVDNTFDKMDVAIALHHRLIVQTEFATLLCCLECEEASSMTQCIHYIACSKPEVFLLLVHHVCTYEGCVDRFFACLTGLIILWREQNTQGIPVRPT